MTERTQKLPPQQETVPGPTYENPNEDEHYTPPEDGSDNETTDGPDTADNSRV